MVRLMVCSSLGLLLLTGCWRPAAPTPAELERGAVWVFPGIEGDVVWLRDAYRAFRDAGVSRAIYIFDWERATGGLSNLVDYPGNRARAAATAERIAAYMRQHPQAVVDFVAYSGGAGIAVFTAEALPDDVRIRNIVIAQGALSPSYDLGPALARMSGRMINHYCESDWWVLGAGTTVWGTMDRKHTSAAGRVGFDPNAALPDWATSDRLVQQRWELDDLMDTGHVGGHIGMLGYAWNKAHVAPHLVLKPPHSPNVPLLSRRSSALPRLTRR